MMAANGRGGMRPQSRSPPFLAVGLFVALCILGFNYWSVSSRNSDLAGEITLLESEVRVLSAKKASAEKRGDSVLDKVRDLEEILKKERSSLGNKEAEIANYNKNLMQKDQEITQCREEEDNCKTSMSTCQENNRNIQTELDSLKEQVKTLQAAAPQSCSESGCKQYMDVLRMQILKILEQSSHGLPAVHSLHMAGIDVGPYVDKIQNLQLNNPGQSGQLGQNLGPQVPNAVDRGTQLGQINQNQVDPHNPNIGQVIQPVGAGQPQDNQLGAQNLSPGNSGVNSANQNVAAYPPGGNPPDQSNKQEVNQLGSVNQLVGNQARVDPGVAVDNQAGVGNMNPILPESGSQNVGNVNLQGNDLQAPQPQIGGNGPSFNLEHDLKDPMEPHGAPVGSLIDTGKIKAEDAVHQIRAGNPVDVNNVLNPPSNLGKMDIIGVNNGAKFQTNLGMQDSIGGVGDLDKDYNDEDEDYEDDDKELKFVPAGDVNKNEDDIDTLNRNMQLRDKDDQLRGQ